MKIITWNCNMAFRNKAVMVLEHKPDILIIPECEHPDKLKFPAHLPIPTDIIWHGINANKGLGVFSYSDYRFKLLDVHDPNIRTILPISVTGGIIDFTLFAIWANNPLDRDNQYIEQVWKALHHYGDLITTEKTILIGDFNSNVMWDKKHRHGNHSSVVDQFAKKKILSLYHHSLNIPQGNEPHPTFSLYRHRHRPYHIDYCFASSDFVEDLESVEVGTYDDWYLLSDHKPLIVTFK